MVESAALSSERQIRSVEPRINWIAIWFLLIPSQFQNAIINEETSESGTHFLLLNTLQWLK